MSVEEALQSVRNDVGDSPSEEEILIIAYEREVLYTAMGERGSLYGVFRNRILSAMRRERGE